MAFVLRYFTEFDSCGVDYVTVVEGITKMSAEYSLPLLAKFDPRSSHTVSLR